MFVTVFLAEIDDKTQLATLLFSARADNRWAVFAGSAAAPVLAAAIGVPLGSALERVVSPQTIKLVAGLGSVAVGLWTLLSR